MMADPKAPADPALASGRLTIDLGALRRNWQKLDELSGNSECAAAVKANAYGVEVEKAVPALWEVGCRTFFVATLLEGMEARKICSDATIYILNGLLPGAASVYETHQLRPVLNSLGDVEEWAREAPGKKAALHVDTGMNRLGLREEEALALVDNPSLMSQLNLSLVMTHLVCGDTPTSLINGCQLRSFEKICENFSGVPRSLANSAGTFMGEAFHLELVRPGIALYGGAALAAHKHQNPMEPVVTAEARILQIRQVMAHESVGYGAAQVMNKDCTIAIVGAGYADGYIRRAGSTTQQQGASVFLNGQKAPLVGRVSMDMIAVDVTGVEGVKRGDYVELFGPHMAASETAAASQTIDYEFFTNLGSRYHRIYKDE